MTRTIVEVRERHAPADTEETWDAATWARDARAGVEWLVRYTAARAERRRLAIDGDHPGHDQHN